MSDDLRNISKGAGAFNRFFEGSTPVDLYRGRPSASMLIPAKTTLPDALAVTQDEPELSKVEPNHYTIAPKDDMPLSLFLQYLKSIEQQARAANI